MQFNLYIRSRELFLKLAITVIFVAPLKEMFKNNDYTQCNDPCQYYLIIIRLLKTVFN